SNCKGKASLNRYDVVSDKYIVLSIDKSHQKKRTSDSFKLENAIIIDSLIYYFNEDADSIFKLFTNSTVIPNITSNHTCAILIQLNGKKYFLSGFGDCYIEELLKNFDDEQLDWSYNAILYYLSEFFVDESDLSTDSLFEWRIQKKES